MKNKNKVIWTVLLGIFIFHGVMEDMIPFANYFDECIALLCFPLAVYDWINGKKKSHYRSRIKSAELILILLFLVCGFVGYAVNQYQTFLVTAMSAVLATKFFMILLTAGYIQKIFPVKLEEQEDSLLILSFLWFGYYVLSLALPDIFCRPEAWDICAKSSLLFALLIFCTTKKIWLYRISLLLMSFMLVMSGKEKAYAGVLILIVLYYLVIHKKVQAKIRYILYMALPIALLAWEKIYYYYIVGNGRFAKSIMTSTSLQIASDYFPIGTGFGTFGSTYAKNFYSPVYYLYGISENPELGVESKQYLTDLFWPILFGETGVIGTVLYIGLILALFWQIQRLYYYNRRKYFLLLYMYVFMLITTFSEAGFMQPAVMIYGFVMGILLQEYEEKKQEKMKFFNQKEQ